MYHDFFAHKINGFNNLHTKSKNNDIILTGGFDMIVVPYSEFYSNPALYKEKAETYGIKILPKKGEKKVSRKIQKKLDALHAVVGILPSELDESLIKAEKLERQ